MIRESVEKLRGYVFTPEELRDVIEPAVKASEGQKYYRNPFERHKLIKAFSNECFYNGQQDYKYYKFYEALCQLAEENPDKLIHIWDKIIKTRELIVPEDCDNLDIINGLDIDTRIRVYDTIYVVTHYERQRYTFVPLAER